MSKMFFKLGLGLLALAGSAWPLVAAVPANKTLPGHVPAVVSRLVPMSQVAPATNMQLSIGLPLRNQEALTNLLQQLYDPASPNYQHYLTPEEFTDQFGPTPADYQTVVDFAATNGFTVLNTYPNRMVLDVVGKVSDVERAFHVTMQNYRHPTEARNFFAPNTEPTVDAKMPVLSVQGLNNYVLPRPMLQKKPASIGQPSIGSGPFGALIGQDFRNAYLPGSSLNGANQMVGLLQFDGYFPSDIQAYETLAGLTNVPLQNVLLNGFNGAPGFNNDEVCLDIEMVIAMAPALSKVVVFEGFFPNSILNSMAANSQIKQLSASWGYATDPTTRQIYIQFLLQGQTYFNCSGDGDAWLGPIPYGSVQDPFVTVVGGTTLTMNGRGVSYASEQAWNWGFIGDYNWNRDGYFGTSGGISTDVTIPFYQVGINMVTNHGSTTFRNVPDVALTADNVFVISSGGSRGVFGGTSAATPLWAGFMALINQQAVGNGKPTIGFLNPAVYAIARSPIYANCFHDTTTGDNTWDLSLTNFFAVPGYDLCTGVGTPNGTNLINTLTGTNGVPIVYVPIFPAPKQPWGTNLSVMNGADPNGLWLLYIQDDTPADSGTNYNGWYLNLTTANPVGLAADNQLYINTSVNSQFYAGATNVPLDLGSIWHMTLAVTNYGPSLSSNVFVADTLPVAPGVTLVSSSLTLGSITNYGDGLIWKMGNLPVGSGGTLTLNFQANAPGVYTNTATVNATTTDPNPDDDTVTVIAGVVVSTPPVIVPQFGLGSGGGFQLTVTGAAVPTVIQASTNLISWVPVYTNTPPFTYTNSDTSSYLMRFYRAVVGP